MSKFRKKPVVIEAVHFAGGRSHVEDFLLGTGATYDGNADTFTIPTLEGDMTAQRGDWIIRGVKGEHYPCKPDIFAATYEPTED